MAILQCFKIYINIQEKRAEALNKFKSGDCKILICTDVAGRGLDIPSVDLVINYDVPTNSKVTINTLAVFNSLLMVHGNEQNIGVDLKCYLAIIKHRLSYKNSYRKILLA